MTISASRVLLPPQGFFADSNARLRHPAERACWVWHPGRSQTETAVLRFRLRFTLRESTTLTLHVTADQRFQLRCDGQDLTFGPDRCDVEHWTVQSIRCELPAGEHELEALAWYIGEPKVATAEENALFPNQPASPTRPMAQMSWRPGFLLAAEGVDASQFNTGNAPWMVEDLNDAVKLSRKLIPTYHDVGPEFHFDLERWARHKAVPAAVVQYPLPENPHGVRRPGWCLYPADLPEQKRAPWTGGTIRAYRASWDEAPVRGEECRAPEIGQWQELIAQKRSLVVPPNTELTVLWDLEDYVCGYPVFKNVGGENSLIEWEWAEALYEEPSVEAFKGESTKGHRSVIENKVFCGFGDSWRIGQKTTETPSLWWRCGRYVRLRVKTSDSPLTLNYFGLITTGYPFETAGKWTSSDERWDRLMPIFIRAYEVGGHEIWTDSPYYEQMSYVGDDALHALSNFAWFPDARLSRRALQLFNWSRSASGFVAERYPANWRQESPTYSLTWPMMVRDYAWWRDDVTFIKATLPGVRSMLLEFDAIAGADGLLHQVPGWPFVDWVPEWNEGLGAGGCGPGVRAGDSSIVNLHWVLALIAAAQLEEYCGEAILAKRYRDMAGRTFSALMARYWDSSRSLLLDTHGQAFASEHAQMFALLTGLLNADQTHGCLNALWRGEGLSKATIYASFYLLDVLYRFGEQDEFHNRLEFWRKLPDFGFTVTPEAPEPSRSDSHAWGAHPAWHTLASIAGVRPDAPEFARVRVAPMPGPLRHFSARVVHPRGLVEVEFRRTADNRSAFSINLPDGIAGSLVFAGQSVPLHPGKNECEIKA